MRLLMFLPLYTWQDVLVHPTMPETGLLSLRCFDQQMAGSPGEANGGQTWRSLELVRMN